ncbi:M4 family metallopeptidase [Pseudoalteromonas luteoviolacea]|nr:M4 family metallopeptidase [Pseudoalteromonas luteoviolacea]
MRKLGFIFTLVGCQAFMCDARAQQVSPFPYQYEGYHIHLSDQPADIQYKLNKTKEVDTSSTFKHYDLYLDDVKVYDSTLVLKKTQDGNGQLISGNLSFVSQLTESLASLKIKKPKFNYKDDYVMEHVLQTYPFVSDVAQVNRLVVLGRQQKLHFIYQVEVKSKEQRRQFITLDSLTLKQLGVSVSKYAFSEHHDESYHPVATTTGNYKLGLNCHQAPNMPTQKCQNTVLPLEHPITQQFFPDAPIVSNIYYRTNNNAAFSEFDGYPMVVKLHDNRCTFQNNWVETYLGSALEPYSYACPDGVEEAHGISGNPYFYYFLKGAFKTVNDGHFFGGITAQTLHYHFKQLFPNQQSRCEKEAGYCLNKIKQRVDAGNLYQSSWDGEFTNYAGGTKGSPFPHGSSLDIVAHEIGHAILEWNTNNIISGFNFEDEPVELRAKRSALHESFSDMTAIAVKDYYARHLQAEPFDSNWVHSAIYSKLYDQNEMLWAIGFDARLSDTFSRHAAMPRLDGVSMDDYREYDQTVGSHQRAGALNKLFYLIASSDGWDIQRAYQLVLKAMTGCFSATAGMYEASQCIIAVADAPDAEHITQLAEKVGFIATDKEHTQLNVSIDRRYGSLRYDFSDMRVSQDNTSVVEVQIGSNPVMRWTPDNELVWQGIIAGQHTLGAGEHDLSWYVELNDGTELETKRLVSLFDGVLCKPQGISDQYITSLSINAQNHEVEQGFNELTRLDPVFKQSGLNIDFIGLNPEISISTYLDLDRNGYFDTNSEKMVNQSSQEGEFVFDLAQYQKLGAGPIVVRFVLSAQEETSSCAGLTNAQVIDLNITLREGHYIAPDIDFGYKQKNSEIHLSINQDFTSAYSFRWVFGNEEIETSEYHIVKSMPQTSEVTLILLYHGVEVNRVDKSVAVLPEPAFSIDCQQNGTECKLLLVGDLPSNITRFAWKIDDQHFTSSNDFLIYDFGTTGLKNVTALLTLQGASVIFERSQSIELKEVVDFDVDVQQENNDFILNISKALPASYSLIWVVNGIEYPHSQTGTILTALSPQDSVSYILQKDGESIFEKRIDIAHVNDPNLKIGCQSNGLECKFLAEHQSTATDIKYVWDFGDGTVIENNAQSINYSYQEAGEYIANITLVIDGRARFTAQLLVKVDVIKPLINIGFKQHNQTLSLSASGEVHDGMAFQWLINNEIRYGQTIDYDFPDKTQITSIKLTVYEKEQEVLEVFENIQVFESSGLDFKWAQDNSEEPLQFSFSIQKGMN